MKIRLGYDIGYECQKPTPMILALNVHHSRFSDLVVPDYMVADPAVPITAYRDGFGNWCTRIIAPKGLLRLSANGVIHDSGEPDFIRPEARQIPVEDLPFDTLVFLLGSRYCETDRLSDTAWQLFEKSPQGWGRVQAICDFVHAHITFDYQCARSTMTAFEVFEARTGVCRDFAHLAIAFCRCMNIPARYCTGYLGDMGMPPPYAEMDFAAWMEVFLDGHWYVFDPRNNTPRIGRILIARGRDAVDVPISTSLGHSTLKHFTVHTEEIT